MPKFSSRFFGCFNPLPQNSQEQAIPAPRSLSRLKSYPKRNYVVSLPDESIHSVSSHAEDSLNNISPINISPLDDIYYDPENNERSVSPLTDKSDDYVPASVFMRHKDICATPATAGSNGLAMPKRLIYDESPVEISGVFKPISPSPN